MKNIFTRAVYISIILFIVSCSKTEMIDLAESIEVNHKLDTSKIATLPKPAPRIDGGGSQGGYMIDCTESTVDWYQQTYVRYSDGTTGGYSDWQYTGTTYVGRICEPIYVGSGGSGTSGGGSPSGYPSPLPREEGTSEATPYSAPADEADLENTYGFGGPDGQNDDGRLSCQSFRFTPVAPGANSQQAGIRGLKFVVNIAPSSRTVRTFSFRTMYVNMGIKKKNGDIITGDMAAEYAAAAANRAGASLTAKYFGKSIQEINALYPSKVEEEFRNLFQVILSNQEIQGYSAVLFRPTPGSSPIISDPVWNGTVTRIFNWLSGKGCAN